MKKKMIVSLKDLNELGDHDFPVLDLVKTNDLDARLGCLTTAMINLTKLTNSFDETQFSNLAEMALYYESLLGAIDGGAEIPIAMKVIDEFAEAMPFEKYRATAEKLPLSVVLVLLMNGFVGMSLTVIPKSEGHADVFYRADEGEVYFNSFQVDIFQLAELIYSHPENIIMFMRNKNQYPDPIVPVEGEHENHT